MKRPTHRMTLLLTGLLICACCGAAQAAVKPAKSSEKTTTKPFAGQKKLAFARTDVEPATNREFRTWTTTMKGATLEAKLMKTSGGNAVLTGKDGTNRMVAINMLSQEDQDYINSFSIKPTRTVSLIPGSKLKPGLKMDFVIVQPGEFQMGSPLYAWGGPEHKVTITKPFYIGKFEVTVAQWKAFADATGHKTGSEINNDGWGFKDGRVGHAPINWAKLGFEQTSDHPVVCVSQIDAKEFCKWASKVTGKSIRLPTEAEWEYAARGPESFAWPWGNKEDLSLFNQADTSCKKAGVAANQWSDLADDGFAFTAPVGSFKNASWCGALDMAGNVREWVEDLYVAYSAEPATDPVVLTGGNTTVRRGGGWRDEFYFSHTMRRDEHPAGDSNDELGFRCAMDL